jgi:hypothetical protein
VTGPGSFSDLTVLETVKSPSVDLGVVSSGDLAVLRTVKSPKLVFASGFEDLTQHPCRANRKCPPYPDTQHPDFRIQMSTPDENGSFVAGENGTLG